MLDIGGFKRLFDVFLSYNINEKKTIDGGHYNIDWWRNYNSNSKKDSEGSPMFEIMSKNSIWIDDNVKLKDRTIQVDEHASIVDIAKEYANDYENSSLRFWLNDEFLNIAFTDCQKENLEKED